MAGVVPGPAPKRSTMVERVTPLDGIIESASKKHGIEPWLLRAVGQQETGLGTSPLYDPQTGLSRTKGNHGHGIWQLDPASGASAADLARAAKDPAFAADYAARMLKHNLDSASGNVSAALAAYNAGNAASAQGLRYAQQVLARAPHYHSRRNHLELAGDLVAGPAPKGGGLVAGPAPKGAAKPQPTRPGAANLAPPLLQQWAGALAQHGLNGYAHVLRGLDDAAQDPLKLLNDVLGAGQRFVAGADTNKLNQHGARRFLPPWMDPQSIGAGIYGATHPNDTNVEAGLEHTIGADKLKVAQPHNVTDRIRNAAVDFGTQTATDPFIGLGATGEVARAGDALIHGLSDATTKALLSHPNPVVRKFIANFVAHPDVRRGFTPSGRAIFKGVANSEATNADRQAATDADLLARYKKQVGNGEVPPELEQRLLRDAYVYGTDDLRKQALEHGYRPTEEEAAKPAEGILRYDLRQDYFPHYGQREYPPDLTPAGAMTKQNTPYAGFEQPQEGELRTDPLESMRLRLNNARSVIRHRMTQKRIAHESGLGLPEYGIPGDENRLKQHVTDDTAAAYKAIDQPVPPEISGIPGMKEFGNMGRDVMIATNPLPHSKNIGVLSYLAGGVKGVTKGLQYAMSGVPKNLADRLDHMGAGGHFMLTQPGNLSTARIVPSFIRKGTQGALDRIDSGMRAARLEQLDREFPNMSEYEKGERVNEDIGAYRDSPAYVSLLRNVFGAQFPQWHGYIVPTAVSRAILRHPERIEQLIRAQQTGNQDVLGDQPYGMDFGGPVSEFGQLTNAPGEALTGKQPTYLTSPSMIGPVASSIAHMGSQSQSYGPTGKDLKQRVLNSTSALDQVIPYYNAIAPQFGINPYNSKAPPDLRTIASFFAAYPKAKESYIEARTRDFMEAGMSRFQAQRRALKSLRQMSRYMKP